MTPRTKILAPLLGLCVPSLALADTVTSVQNGTYTDGSTWDDGLAPDAGNDYVIEHQIEIDGDATTNLAGDSVTINSGWLRLTAVDASPDTFNINGLDLNGGRFDIRSHNQYSREVDLPNPITVSADSQFRIGDGGEQFDMEIIFTAGLSGSGALNFVSNSGNDAGDTATLHLPAANSTFTGAWSVNSVDSGFGRLSPEAANALGSGSVTLGTRSRLVSAAADALNSTPAITLNTSTSELILTNGWVNLAGVLDIVDPAATLNLVDSASSIDILYIAGTSIPAGTYTATDLTALGLGGTFLGATGTIEVAGLPNPTLDVDPTFAFTNNGLAENLAVEVRNFAGDATTPLTISSITPTGTDAGTVSNIVNPGSVAAGGSANITFDFTPGSGSGTYEFDLEIASDDAAAASPAVVSVVIDVLPNPVLSVTDTTDFVNNGVLANYSIPISNLGNDGVTALNISGVVATGTDSPDVSNIVWPASVASGASTEITFDFNPSLGIGFYDFTLEITSDDDSGEAIPREVFVTIDVQDPIISIASNSLSFGEFAANPGPQTATITVTNNGGSNDLTIDGGLSDITGSPAFSITSVPGAIAPGATGDIEITFDPGLDGGEFNGTLTIVSNDSIGTTPEVSLSAFVFPSGDVAALDFGPAPSPVDPDYVQFVATEGASQTVAGVNVTLESRDADIIGSTGANVDPLLTDSAQTTFNGNTGNYISVLLSGFNTGTLNWLSSHDYPSSFGLPLNLEFGEVGSLSSVETGLQRPGTASGSFAVEAGKTYELRVIESGNANLAYISGLLLWGDAIPGGTPFGSFVTAAGLDPLTDGAPGLDPDLDGVQTGIEWVVGGDPNSTTPDTSKLPTQMLANADPDNDTNFDDYLVFTYRRTTAAADDPNTTIDVTYGSDLNGWLTATDGVDGVVIVEIEDGFGGDLDQVNVYLPTSLAVGGKLFARLDVTIAP